MNPILSNEFIPKNIPVTYKSIKKIRIILSICAILLYYLINQTNNILNKTYIENGKCYLDPGFILSKSLNNMLINNSFFYHFCVILASILLDSTFLLAILSWFIYDKYWSALITIAFFYGIRGFLQNIYRNMVPKDNGWIWYYPNFPSICVNYFEGNDFFFSGHVGICILNAFFAVYRKHYIFSGICFFAGSFEAFLVLITRTHYTIDIPIGFFFAHYSCIIVDFWVRFFFEKKNCEELFEHSKEKIIEKSQDLDILS